MNWTRLVPQIFPILVTAVRTVERMNATGPQKRAAVIDTVMDALAIAEGVTGRDLADDARVRDTVGKLVDAYVAVENVVRDVKAKADAAKG